MGKSASVGTVLKVGTGSSAKSVGGLTSIAGVEVTADSIDVTALDNSSGYREFLAGFKDGGEVPISGFLDGADDGQEELYTLLGSGAVSSFAIIFPTAIGKTWSFSAVVTGFSTNVDVDNAITFDVTLKVSGAPTLADTPTSGGGSG